ncbi:MAG: hypothetical protein K0R18_32 [Bacillales bacterium]|jgi:hypothetical protein|nr:hypothetical protein [Bacillales bacterium]
MSKKSWLEKIGLVESTNNTDHELSKLEATYGSSLADDNYVPTVEVDMSGEDFLDVPAIYERSGLADKSRSIFKVDEFTKVLPDSMTTDQKRQSVIGILAVNGLTIEELQADAEQRLGALQTVSETTTNNTAALIIEKDAEITRLLSEVDALKQQINERKLSQEHEDKLIKEEVDKVSAIVKFISA